MRPKDIICKDLMMNSTKRMQNRQLTMADSLLIYDDEYGTPDLVQNLFLDRSLHFFARREIIDISQNPEFSLRILKDNPPDKSITLSMDISLSIDKDELSLFFMEHIEGFPSITIGRTRIIRNLKEPMDGHKGRGAIIIDPCIKGDARFCSLEADGIVPTVSLGFGGYLLATMDGKWEDVEKDARVERAKDHILEDEDLKDKIHAFLEDMKGLKDEIRTDKKDAKRLEATEKEAERLRSSISGFRKIISEEKKKNVRLKAERDELAEKVSAFEKRLRKANAFIARASRSRRPIWFELTDGEAPAAPPDAEETATVSEQETEDLSGFDGKEVYVIGGREDWVTKAEEHFPPSWHFLGNRKNFDGSGLKNADFLLVNINSTAHCVVEKAKRLASKAKVITSTARNIEVFSRDVARSARG